jgi:hypothetical protein
MNDELIIVSLPIALQARACESPVTIFETITKDSAPHEEQVVVL